MLHLALKEGFIDFIKFIMNLSQFLLDHNLNGVYQKKFKDIIETFMN